MTDEAWTKTLSTSWKPLRGRAGEKSWGRGWANPLLHDGRFHTLAPPAVNASERVVGPDKAARCPKRNYIRGGFSPCGKVMLGGRPAPDDRDARQNVSTLWRHA